MCGTLRPTRGTVEVNGRIAALLELGAGFNPEFTGRENVYLNAAILGLSRAEIDERFDSIARFADIGDFIEQPVKTYSSGMYVRLAFATAINVDPDILVVDEALAVGDEAFQRKCFARIEEIKDKGGTILFVSHGAQTIVQLCSRAMLIDGGELILEGRPKTVVSQYQRLVNLSGVEAAPVRESIRAMKASSAASAALCDQSLVAASTAHDAVDHEGFDPTLKSQSRTEYVQSGARIRDWRIVNSSGQPVNLLEMGRRYAYQYDVDFNIEVTNVGFGMLIRSVEGTIIAGAGTNLAREFVTRTASPGQSLHVSLEFECIMLPGTYFLNAGVVGSSEGVERYLHRILDAMVFRVLPVKSLIATGVVDIGVRPMIRPGHVPAPS